MMNLEKAVVKRFMLQAARDVTCKDTTRVCASLFYSTTTAPIDNHKASRDGALRLEKASPGNRLLFKSVIQRRRRIASAHRSFSTHSSPQGEEILVDHRTNENLPGAVVSILTLNRPKANAMGKDFLGKMKEQLTLLENSSSRCVILTSFSDRVFSAGADLKERKAMTQSEAAAFVTDLRQTMERIRCLPMPVIAAIEGAALGGGLELALAADFRVVSRSATLGLPETSLAIIPGAGGTQQLSRLVGPTKAKELIFTAARLTGEQASEVGLVDILTEPGDALTTSMEFAWKMAKNGPVAIRAAKEAINRGVFASSMQEALDIERECYGRVLQTQDRLEGLAAFQESRTPEYKGH